MENRCKPMETVTGFIFLSSKITADGDCSHEIKKKKNLLAGRKVITNLLSSFSSDFTAPSAVILEPPEIKSVTVSIISPSICHEVMGLDAMILF